MLSEKIMSVFDAAMKFLSAEGYVVVPKSEVKKALCADMAQSEIDASLNALQMNELIKIRYSDGEVYCLSALPKGIRENEIREEMREAERRKAALLAEEERRAALAAEEADGETEEEADDGSEETATENADEEENGGKPRGIFGKQKIGAASEENPKTAAPIAFSYKKAAIFCGLSAFLGSFLAGVIILIVILAKLG